MGVWSVVGPAGAEAIVVSGGVWSGASNAPMSQAGPWGRGTPRWSTGRHAGSPASNAGLSGPMACVGVGPPLKVSRPSSGSVFCLSVPEVKPHEVAPSRLWPAELIVDPGSAEQSSWPATVDVFLARIVFLTVAVPDAIAGPPPSRDRRSR